MRQIVQVRMYYCNIIIFERVSIKERLGYKFASGIYILNLFRSNVLTLLKFEYVFLSIDNFKGTIW